METKEELGNSTNLVFIDLHSFKPKEELKGKADMIRLMHSKGMSAEAISDLEEVRAIIK